MSRIAVILCMNLCAVVACGCAVNSQGTFTQFERGQKRPVVDGVGWVMGVPGKIGLWNSRVDNHMVSDETEAEIAEYMAANGLESTKVRINQYAPGDEWVRLTQNDNVGPGWRYSLGVLHTLGYTIFPGRIFGGDRYNPYTDTLSVFSDVPSLALVEAAYARDVTSRKYPGTYAAVQSIPGLDMWHTTLATEDVIDYYDRRGRDEELKEAYHVLMPRYGYGAGSAVASYVGAATPLQVGGLLVGHAYGRYRGALVDPARHPEQDVSQPGYATISNDSLSEPTIVPVGGVKSDTPSVLRANY